jgi:hypothetical protein
MTKQERCVLAHHLLTRDRHAIVFNTSRIIIAQRLVLRGGRPNNARFSVFIREVARSSGGRAEDVSLSQPRSCTRPALSKVHARYGWKRQTSRRDRPRLALAHRAIGAWTEEGM